MNVIDSIFTKIVALLSFSMFQTKSLPCGAIDVNIVFRLMLCFVGLLSGLMETIAQSPQMAGKFLLMKT